MTRWVFLSLLFAASCALNVSHNLHAQSSATTPTWHIGKVALQADDEWLMTTPLQQQSHVRGSGSIVQKRVVDDITFADSPNSQQKRVGIGFEPDLSPDGKTVVYCGITNSEPPSKQLIRVEVETGKRSALTQLKNGACSPAFSPDGSKIAFNTEGANGAVVGILDLATTTVFAISPGVRPRWSPDGKKLVFLRWPETSGGPQTIWVVNADGTGLKKIADTRALLPSANWGADGASVVFNDEDHHRSAIYRADLESAKIEKIAGGKDADMFFPSVSPDGRELLVILDSDMAPTLVSVDLETHKSRTLCKALRASVRWARDQ